jgi:hypothetical protein
MFRITMTVGMNRDVYADMPDDVKQIVDEMDKDAKYSTMAAEILHSEYTATMDRFLSEVATVIEWSDEDEAKLDEICAGIFDEWIAEKEAMGLPAREIVTDYYNALKAVGVENPARGFTP